MRHAPTRSSLWNGDGKGSAPLEPKMKISITAPLRFLIKLRSSGECILWPYKRTAKGYGCFMFAGSNVRAHRISYMLHVGSVPNGLLVCHACDVPACVNPRHLWLGTNTENMQDAVNKGRLKRVIKRRPVRRREKTHCRRGHRFTPESTSVCARGRECLICRRRRSRKLWALSAKKINARRREKAKKNRARHLVPE